MKILNSNPVPATSTTCRLPFRRGIPAGILCLLLAAQPAGAKIWRVNNTAGVAHDYVAIADAVAAANRGDTIHIEGSVTPYNESVTVDKKLYLFGPGYDLTVNPETQHIKYSAKVSHITFAAGSDSSVLAGVEQIEHTAQLTLTKTAGSTSAGININFPGPTGGSAAWGGATLNIAASNIKVVNCKLNYVKIDNSGSTLKNIDIRKCWFCPGVVLSAANTNAVENLNLINNFFRNDHATSVYRVIDLHAVVKANIGNNTFYGGFKVTAPENCRITNNVFYLIHGRAVDKLTNSVSNEYRGNIANMDQLGGMVNGQNGNTIRTSETNEEGSTVWFSATGGIAMVDKYFIANNTASSPVRQAAVFAGTTGELGMFGGLAPFVLSGLTNIPSVYEIIMPAEVSSDGFEVTVKVKAH